MLLSGGEGFIKVGDIHAHNYVLKHMLDMLIFTALGGTAITSSIQ